MIQTAEEFFEQNKIIPFHTDIFHYGEIYDIMIEFAKMHTKKALEQASKSTLLYDFTEEILNSYNLDNIK